MTPMDETNGADGGAPINNKNQADDTKNHIHGNKIPPTPIESDSAVPAEQGAAAAGTEMKAAAEREALLKRERRQYVISETKEWVKSIVIALVLALILKAYVVQAYMIPTGSMEPTIMPRDRVFGNRFIYHFRDPKPGDIIAFIPPKSVTQGSFNMPPDEQPKGILRFLNGEGSSQHVTSYLKRVIATGGSTVEVREGRVLLNGVPLDEPYIQEEPNYEYPLTKVPKDMIFVLGDNRCNSHDSHVWGFLPKKNIQAKTFFRFWPPGRIGVVR
jgi:signal peptidase I